MKKIYKNEIQRLMPLFQAIAEGKTVQWNDMGVWRDIDGDDEGFFLDTFVGKTVGYRIKPEPKYRPFKDAEECWQEMQKHQPFGWIKSKDDSTISKFLFIDSLSDEIATIRADVRFAYSELVQYYIFADGTPFGILEEE